MLAPFLALFVAGCLAPDMAPYVNLTSKSAANPTIQAEYRANALEIIAAIANGDTETIERLVSPDRYIRHDRLVCALCAVITPAD